MLITKEHQQELVNKYVKEKHNTDECLGFVDGMNTALELVKNLTIPVVSGSLHIDFGIWLTGHNKETIEQMFKDWNKKQ